MKKIITLLLVIAAVQATYAQDDNERIFKKFKVNFSLGYAAPQGDGTKAGAVVVIEPKYAVMEQLAIGLRLELAALVNINMDKTTGMARGVGSYLATGDYYFSHQNFRPFCGVGAGIFTTATATVSESDAGTFSPYTSQFGFMARTGFEYGHLRLGVEYNFLKDNAAYLSFKLGVNIGGGRKK